MGKTHRYQNDGEIVNFRSKRKGKQSRKQRKSKASLSKLIYRSHGHILNEEELAAIEQVENGEFRMLNNVEELLEELNDTEQQGRRNET